MPEEIELRIPSGRVAGRAWGPSDGRRVLALHGWLDNAASFDELAPRLPHLRLVALDFPGHGRSEHAPPGFLYPFLDLVAAAHHAAQALGWERYGLLGHSMGAGVASLVAGMAPEQIEALVLLEGIGPLSEAAHHAPDRLRQSLLEQARKAERARKGGSRTVHADRGAAVQRLISGTAKMRESSARTLLERGLQTVDGGVTWRTDPRLRVASRVRMTEPQVLAFLGAIASPTLYLKASDGFGMLPGRDHPRVEAIADLTYVELPGGHHVHLDDPEPVADAVRSFLADHVPS